MTVSGPPPGPTDDHLPDDHLPDNRLPNDQSPGARPPDIPRRPVDRLAPAWVPPAPRVGGDESSLVTPEPRRRRGRRLGQVLATRLGHPLKLTAAAFLTTVGVITLLLRLPLSAEPGQHTTFLQALFTATGASCGALANVDTPTHWSTFGEVVIMFAVQLGGLGFMTTASLLGLLVSRRLGVRIRLLAATETQSVGIGDVRRVVRGVALITLAIEGAAALVLFARLWLGHGLPAGRAAYHGVFHAVTGFNNAGYALYSDNLVSFADDPVVVMTIGLAAILGGLGFPVLFELRHELRKPRLWSMHTKVTLLGYGVLLVGGAAAVLALEWRNPATLGPLGAGDKLLGGFFGSVTARTAGFNTFDYGAAQPATLVVTDILMFIGGGSASTAGGIKVTTFLILFFAIVAEARGDDTVDAFGRQVSPAALRQAIAVALLGVALVVAGTLCLLISSHHTLDQTLFEVTSAFGTVGLSTGITGGLPAFDQYVLIALMLIGRIGPITLASALALRERRRLYRLPEERPIVG
ncbi:potassium transporter TrkG [Pseudofrankia sp. BMG5.37]|nr:MULTISPECIES: potassium transporter TrkG [unclassified Pseudofrankia]MDT3446217.1 potassium transporter TrkG [Pseudofrankia sp. BMG5.37]